MKPVQLSGKVGIEIELLAPRGASRETLASEIAAVYKGNVRRFFYPQSEPSKIPGTPVLENLTLGFEVLDEQAQPIAWCVDDLTLQADCDRTVSPKPGWYRIVTDDLRLLELITRWADPNASVTDVLNPVADLFGVAPEVAPNGMVKIGGKEAPPIAIAAPLPGERERPCELITAPLTSKDLEKLDTLLQIVRRLGFSIPLEGAVHFHFDAAPLCNARVFKNLVNLLWTYGPTLRRLVGANPYCQRVGKLPIALVELVEKPNWEEQTWDAAVEQLQALKLTKYCDFNLKNLVYAPANKHTFEARIFPVWLDAQFYYHAIGLMASVLQRAQASEPVPLRSPLAWRRKEVEGFLVELPLPAALRQHWIQSTVERLASRS